MNVFRRIIRTFESALLICAVTASCFAVLPGSARCVRAQKSFNLESREVPESADKKAEKILKGMSTDEKLAQMLIISPEALSGNSGTVTAADSRTKKGLKKYNAGGVFFLAKNLRSRSQTRSMIKGLQSQAKKAHHIPLFMAVDEEGGQVARCAEKLGTSRFRPMYFYHSMGRKTAEENARTIGKDISSLGFNLDFAPVADTWTNPRNTVIGTRAYSKSYKQAAELIPSAVKGFHRGGTACTLKHFPGHGNTSTDSHKGSVYVNKTLKQLKSGDLKPFAAGIEAGADMVMTGHITDKKISNLPASLSRKMVTGILRKDMGFEGVIITDGLGMSAVSDRYSEATAAVMAVRAGNDMVLGVTDPEKTIKALKKALKNKSIKQEQIDASVKRILILKIRLGLI